MHTLDKFFEEAKNVKNFDWKNSTFCGIKERSDVNSNMIIDILKWLRRDRAWTFTEVLSKRIAIIYWVNRLLENNNMNQSNRLGFLKHQERDLIFVTKHCISHNDNVDFESLLKVQQEIVNLEPNNGKALADMVDTCMKLERYVLFYYSSTPIRILIGFAYIHQKMANCCFQIPFS